MPGRFLSLTGLNIVLLLACGAEGSAPVPESTSSAAAPQSRPGSEASSVGADSGTNPDSLHEHSIEDSMNGVAYAGASFPRDGSRIPLSGNRSGNVAVYALASLERRANNNDVRRGIWQRN